MYNRSMEFCKHFLHFAHDSIHITRHTGEFHLKYKGLKMLELDAITLAIASLLYLLGIFIVNHVSILRKLCIPAPVIGGLIFSILVAILQSTNIITIKLDSEFIQNFFMLAFFTTIGLGASFYCVWAEKYSFYTLYSAVFLQSSKT